ncbi:MAG: hypothetical protein IT186_13220 [Acidobacteria bacterium]|nr:hypothetical protein [Acidobacteriota bacterium]
MNGIHGDDPVRDHDDLCEVVDEFSLRSGAEGRTSPVARVRLMQDVA